MLELIESLEYFLTCLSQFLAFVVGFITQNIHNTLWIGLGGTALTFVVCVPPWPFYNKNPVRWLPSKNASASAGAGYTGAAGLEGIEITVDGKKVQ